MANKDAAFGFKPVRTLGGTPYNASMAKPYYVPSTYATALFLGDLVSLAGTATANAAAVSDSMNGGEIGTFQTIIRGAQSGGTALEAVGVIVGFEPLRTDLTKQYNAASTERVVYVCDAPDMIYHVQEDGDGGAIGAAGAGLNAEIIVGTGNTVTGRSTMELDSSSAATTATLPIRLLSGAAIPDNDVSLANAVWEVMINTHVLRQTTGAN